MPPTATAPSLPASAASARFRLSRRELALIAAFWTLFALLTVANRLFGVGGEGPGPRAPLAGPVAVAFAESLCWALLTPAIFWVASRGDADGETRLVAWVARIVVLLALGVAAAAAVTLIGYEVRGLVGVRPGGPRLPRMSDVLGPEGPGFPGDPLGRGGPGGPGDARGPGVRGAPWRGGPLWFAFANAVLVALGIHAAGLARAYSLRYRARHEQAVRLQAQLAEARLDALRRQLDPHFLFNTLNAVSALVERDPRGVRRMIARLSDLLRHSFEGTDEAEVPLRDELALVGRYVDIMQVRFQGRLTVETHADARALDALVPSMILQPLVENAIRHGVERMTSPGQIEIEGCVEGSEVVLRVWDNGPGPGAAPDPGAGALGDRRGGVGLRNTVERLAQLHGDAQRFTLAPGEDGGTVAEVRLPYRTRAGPPGVEGAGTRAARRADTTDEVLHVD